MTETAERISVDHLTSELLHDADIELKRLEAFNQMLDRRCFVQADPPVYGGRFTRTTYASSDLDGRNRSGGK